MAATSANARNDAGMLFGRVLRGGLARFCGAGRQPWLGAAQKTSWRAVFARWRGFWEVCPSVPASVRCEARRINLVQARPTQEVMDVQQRFGRIVLALDGFARLG